MFSRHAADLARPGVWCFADSLSAKDSAALALRVQELAYSAMWLPETIGRDPFAHIAYLANGTESLLFATGIANIYHRHPGVMKQAANTVAEQSGDRFLLGLGVSHERTVAGVRGLDYSRPLAFMREYLRSLDAGPYAGPPPSRSIPVLLAALGPKMTQLAAESASGIHSYSTPPRHTARARAILGPEKLLCVEQKVVLTRDVVAGRALARRALGRIIGLPNYRRCWLSLGLAESDIENVSDAFVDAIVAVGDEQLIRDHVQHHYDAGATHVCINPLDPAGSSAPDMHALQRLSGVLGSATTPANS
jgi:probable F420-dependent oxidoreductase